MAARGHGTGDLPGSCALHGSWVDGSRRARAAAEHWLAGLAACYPDVLPPRGIGGLARQRGSDDISGSCGLHGCKVVGSRGAHGCRVAGSRGAHATFTRGVATGWVAAFFTASMLAFEA